MYQSIPTGIKFRVFVKERNADRVPEESDADRKYSLGESLNGSKIREFYENLLKGSSVPPEQPLIKSKSLAKVAAKPVQTATFKGTDFLRLSQNNDVNNLKIFFPINKDYNVNVIDDVNEPPFVWASGNRAEDEVGILLQNGADLHKSDRFGNAVLKVARQKNCEKIVQIFENSKSKPEVSEYEVRSDESTQRFFCPTCKENFTVNKNKHESSIVHLFNSQRKSPTFYGIPESNKGFQLLLKEGWNKGNGLGRNESGRKFPVKAVMKNDRAGIGAPSPRHSRKKNKSKTQSSERCAVKKRNVYKKWKEKEIEKKFRLDFY